MGLSRARAATTFAKMAMRSPSTARLALDAGLTALRLRRTGLRPLMASLDDSLPTTTAVVGRAAATRVDEAMVVLPFEPTCLRRSVALLRELNRNGTSAELVIGVRPAEPPPGVEAHAWVECENEVVNDEDDMRQRYDVIATGSDVTTVPNGLR